MSGVATGGSPAPTVELPEAAGLRVAVVAARWHEDLTDALRAGAHRVLREVGITDVVELRVPGAAELPVVAARLAPTVDAVVALGVVVRGGTPHFEYVCQACVTGLTTVAVTTGVPVGLGVLTCDTVEQARDRSGLPGSREDKGAEATEAAVATVLALRAAGVAPLTL